jgi:hypothetical protein
MSLDYEEMTEDEWNMMPEKPGKQPDELDRLLDRETTQSRCGRPA